MKETVWFFHGESTPACRDAIFILSPHGSRSLVRGPGGRVATNSLIVKSKVSHKTKDTGETGGREVFDGGDGISKRSIDWGNGENILKT
jgi:hypothetical protein